MKIKIAGLVLVMSLLPSAGLHSAAGDWSAVRFIIQGLRNTASLVDAAVFLEGVDIPIGFKINLPLIHPSYSNIAIRVSDASGQGYVKLIEIWTKRSGTWYKGVELYFNSINSGRVYVKPFAFDSVNYSAGSKHQIDYSHSVGTRSMTVYSHHSPALNNVSKSIGTAVDTGGYVSVYLTAHLNSSFGGSGTNDAYLFGARISAASPYYAVAKQGVNDQGNPPAYDFTAYGASWPINASLFNSGGFYYDGSSGGGLYPQASDVSAAGLPTAAQVNAVDLTSRLVDSDPGF